MTTDEFDRWIEDLGARYPAIRAWVRNLGASDAKLLMEAWQDALTDVDLRDALEINRRMMTGDDPGPGEGAWKWQELPSHVLALARAYRFRSHDPCEPDRHEPRYKCRQCRDKGFVTVASREATAHIFEFGTLANCRHRVGTVLCICDAGQFKQKVDLEKFNDPKRRREKSAVMSEWFFVTGPGDLMKSEEVAEFAEWCHERREAWNARKRHAEFDQYNAKEFV